jgi:hypothetical protein
MSESHLLVYLVLVGLLAFAVLMAFDDDNYLL